MAIGTSITPRSYNVDPTGRDYVLDPDPLLNIAEKSFATQRETQRMIGAVAQQGVQIGEYIAARQQLGRVKAALSELDVNDPMFAQKYSAVVADNALAFTNEKVAPATKMAVTPVLASAAQAMENKAALQRAQVMAGYQRQAAVQRAGLQQDYYDYQIQNPRPAQPRQPGLGERLLFGDSVIPSAQQQEQRAAQPSTGASAPTTPIQGPPGVETYGPDLPLDSSDAYGGGLIPFTPYDTEGPRPEAFDATGLIEGEGDGQTALPPNIRNTPLGPMRVTNVGEGASLEPVVEAVPVREVPQGYMDIPDAIIPETGTAASRKIVPVPEKSGPQLQLEKEAEDTYIAARPEVQKMNAAALSAKALVESQKARIAALPESDPDKPRLSNQLAQDIILAAEAEAAATLATNTARLKFAADKNPAVRNALIADYDEALLNSMPVYGPPQETAVQPSGQATAPPAAPAAPPAPLSAREQLAAQRSAASNQMWTEEKNFAMSEAAKLDAALGFTPGTVARAMTSDVEAKRVLDEAERRGIQSPLFTVVQAPGYSGPSTTTRAVPRFARSQRLGRSYRDILSAAAKEQPGFTGGQKGFKWTRK